MIAAPSGSHVSVLPATLGERARAAGAHEVTPEAILFRVPGTLTALVSATDIDIEPVSGVDAGELTWWREHHLASAQRLLRGTLSLWASGIVCAGGAVAFIGEERPRLLRACQGPAQSHPARIANMCSFLKEGVPRNRQAGK